MNGQSVDAKKIVYAKSLRQWMWRLIESSSKLWISNHDCSLKMMFIWPHKKSVKKMEAEGVKCEK